MKENTFRVRFAPAPTGMMHLGNIRTALMNYLIAQQKQGCFILRIEDTDKERNYDPQALKIQEDLSWLSLHFNEGPNKGGSYGPYFQSERDFIYQTKLQELISLQKAYRCFCNVEELEKKRQRQIALKQPPRYDRTCHKISKEESFERSKNEPFIWRVYLDHSQIVQIQDLAHGTVTFDLKNFSDFPITRNDGSVTFVFANFIDDMLMKISCVIRGEDHLSNTASQVALYHAFNTKIPLFWHMPILCNINGKKLSKRDFGFSLRDLKDEGFLPEAIVNYLAIIGSSFKKEIMTMEEIVQAINFDHISTTGQIRYDVEKLRWVNQKWINLIDENDLYHRCKPYLEKEFPKINESTEKKILYLLNKIKPEMTTLKDCVQLLKFYFEEPIYDNKNVTISEKEIHSMLLILKDCISNTNEQNFITHFKSEITKNNIHIKQAFMILRYIITGSEKGLGISDLFEILPYETIKQRIENFII